MVAPDLLGSEHTLFLCGNDGDAKAAAAEIVRSFGWSDVLDLGDLSAARGMEMYLPLWLRLYGAAGTPNLNVKVVVG
jgi:predicted dinucleotide-binding enzyme